VLCSVLSAAAMQPAKERTLVLDDEEEEEVEGVTKKKEGKKTSPGRVDAASTEVQQAPGASTVPGEFSTCRTVRARYGGNYWCVINKAIKINA